MAGTEQGKAQSSLLRLYRQTGLGGTGVDLERGLREVDSHV